MTVRNAGGCEWTAAAGYGWRGTDGLAGETGSLWQPVPAGGNLTFEREVIPPSTPGTYRYGVQLTRNGTDFGPSMFVDVIVVARGGGVALESIDEFLKLRGGSLGGVLDRRSGRRRGSRKGGRVVPARTRGRHGRVMNRP